MKVLIFSDTHIRSRSADLDKTAEQSFDWLAEQITICKPLFVFFAGDLFDSPASQDTTAINIAIQGIRKVRAALPEGSQIIMIAGNHDYFLKKNNRQITTLEMFRDLPSVTIVDQETAQAFPPFLCAAYKATIDKKNNTPYLIGHVPIQGLWFTKETQDKEGLSADSLSNFKHTFIGHYHLPIANSYTKISVIGSLLAYNYSYDMPISMHNKAFGCLVIELVKNNRAYEMERITRLINPFSDHFFSINQEKIEQVKLLSNKEKNNLRVQSDNLKADDLQEFKSYQMI